MLLRFALTAFAWIVNTEKIVWQYNNESPYVEWNGWNPPQMAFHNLRRLVVITLFMEKDVVTKKMVICPCY